MITSGDLGSRGLAVARGRTVLRDESRDDELRRLGVTQQPFLTADEVDALADAYWKAVPGGDHGLTVDYMRPDRAVVRRLSSLLTDLWARRLDDLTVDHQVVMATFVVKHPGAESAMFLHDDRSYVDERRHRAATIWIPLVDVGPDIPNGGLSIVPRSHLLPTGWSGSNAPDVIRPYEAALRECLVPVEAVAGTAVVYDTRVLHASEPNLSGHPRVAIVCAVAPREARLIHVVATGRRHRVLHAIDDQFFLDHHPREIEVAMPEDCPVVEELDEVPVLSPEQVRDVLGLDRAPAADVPLPPDVSDVLGDCPRSTFPAFHVPYDAAEDLVVTVDEAITKPQEVPVVDVLGTHGSWSRKDLVRRFRPVGSLPPQARGRTTPSTRIVRDQDLLVLEPGARLTVRARRTPRWATEIVTLEAPVVGGGIAGRSGAIAADVGHGCWLPQEEDLVIWNDGPGQLVLLASRIPRPGTPIGTVLHRCGRRRSAQLVSQA